MLRVTDKCSRQPADGEGQSYIHISAYSVKTTALKQDLLKNQVCKLLGFMHTKVIIIGSYFCSLELIHLSQSEHKNVVSYRCAYNLYRPT